MTAVEAAPAHVCSVCKDTHWRYFQIHDHHHRRGAFTEKRLCELCPKPCTDCRGEPLSSVWTGTGFARTYCQNTPCVCDCHKPERPFFGADLAQDASTTLRGTIVGARRGRMRTDHQRPYWRICVDGEDGERVAVIITERVGLNQPSPTFSLFGDALGISVDAIEAIADVDNSGRLLIDEIMRASVELTATAKRAPARDALLIHYSWRRR